MRGKKGDELLLKNGKKAVLIKTGIFRGEKHYYVMSNLPMIQYTVIHPSEVLEVHEQ
jgi:hypothetical protein